MKIEIKSSDGIQVVEIDSRAVDASNAQELKTHLAPLLKPEARLVLDLARVGFIDSTGLGVLVSCLRQIHGTGGEIKLGSLTKPVRALFELVRMHRVFEIFNTSEEAVRSYAVASRT
jgi:anti-sigma B factor antagonist